MARPIVDSRETRIELARVQKRVNYATIYALKRVQTMTRASIRSGMRGKPRWNRRGKSAATGPEVILEDMPKHRPRSGGPGKFTGTLISSIRKSKRPRRVGDEGYSAVVFGGGFTQGGVNKYKRKVEKDTPYFVPGVKRAELKMEPVWRAAYAKATASRR